MEWPNLTLGIITYSRPKELVQTVTALLDTLVYPIDKVKLIISDDSTPAAVMRKVKKDPVFARVPTEFISTESNSGWGVNANHLISKIDTDFWYLSEDDYVSGGKLDLQLGVALMLVNQAVGMVRYRGTAGTHMLLHQLEADIAAYLPNYQDSYGLPGKLTYCLLDRMSPDLWIYSNGPHLRSKQFDAYYGLYPVGQNLANTETGYAITVKEKMSGEGAPAIAILPDYITMKFDHIGKSWQNSEYDK